MEEKKKTLPSMKEFKREALELRKNDSSVKKHRQALNKLATIYGYKNWNTVRPQLREDEE